MNKELEKPTGPTLVAQPAAAEASRGVGRALDRWQVLLILVAMPLLYLANSFTPWSFGLFGRGQREYYLPFMTSILVLHWLSVLLVVWMVRSRGGTLAELGLNRPVSTALGLLALTAAVGALLIAYRRSWPVSSEPLEQWQMLFPLTRIDRVVWIFISFSAGYCEELVYRGFGIRVLQQRGFRTWKAVALTTCSFVLIHGVAGVILFPAYYVVGLIFAGIFLWRKSLLAPMVIHALNDILAVLAL